MTKKTVILLLNILCLLITPIIIIGAIVLKKITLPTFVEKLKSLISLNEAIYLENFLQETIPTIPTSLIEKVKSLIQFNKINIFSREVLTDLILERTLWEGLIVLTLTLTILVAAGLTLRSGCCLLLAVTLGLTVLGSVILIIILYDVIESVKLESAKLESAKSHRDPSAWYWKDHWLFNWLGKNQPVISPKFETPQEELEKLLEKLELEKLELEKLLETSSKFAYLTENIEWSNFTWGEVTLTFLVCGLYSLLVGVIIADAFDLVLDDPIVKYFLSLAVAPLFIVSPTSPTVPVIVQIADLIMSSSKTFEKTFEKVFENKLLEKAREAREVRETLKALKIPQEELEKFLSKTPEEMALEIYYITENIALNIALSDMTSGEITLMVLSSMLLGAVIGVTIGVIANLVLIITFLTSLVANQVLVLLIRLVKVFGKVVFAGAKDLKFPLKGSIPRQLKIPKLKEIFAFVGFNSLMVKLTTFLETVNNAMLTTKVYLFIQNLSSFWQTHILFVNLILFYIIVFIFIYY